MGVSCQRKVCIFLVCPQLPILEVGKSSLKSMMISCHTSEEMVRVEVVMSAIVWMSYESDQSHTEIDIIGQNGVHYANEKNTGFVSKF